MSKFFRVGGVATDTASDIIFLRANIQTSGRVSTFRKGTLATTSGYAITAGKQFYICKILISTPDGGAIEDSCAIGYADNDVGYDVTTARTNPVPIFGDPEQTTSAAMGGIKYNPNRADDRDRLVFGWGTTVIPAAPAGKYMYAKFIGASSTDVQIWGVEETV